MQEQSELTPWFDGKVKPVRVGIYQRRYNVRECDFAYAMWDGSLWLCYMPTIEHAAEQERDCGDVSHNQNGLPWRGLTSKATA